MEKMKLAVRGGGPGAAAAADAVRLLKERGITGLLTAETEPEKDPAEAVLRGEASVVLYCGRELPYRLSDGLSVEGVLPDGMVPAFSDAAEPHAEKAVPRAYDGLLLLVCRTGDRDTAQRLHAASALTDMERFAIENYLLHLLPSGDVAGAGVHADVTPQENEEDRASISLAIGSRTAHRTAGIGGAKKMCHALRDIVCNESGDKGTVTIVGAGCGINLMTVRGLRAVQKADVLVYDSYDAADVLAEARPDCRMIYADEQRRDRVLVREAKEGNYVVLLLNGDACFAGFGGTMLPFLQANEIPFDIIPGVSPVTAYPAAAGIPILFEGISNSYTVVTVDDILKDNTDYDSLGEVETTVLFRLKEQDVRIVAGRLMTGGRDGDTPTALLTDCYGPDKTVRIGTLGTIARRIEDTPAMAVLLVGDVVAYDFSATRQQPLTGVTITIAGSRTYSHRLAGALTELGALCKVLPYANVVVRPNRVPQFFNAYQSVLFTDGTAVDAFMKTLSRRTSNGRLPRSIGVFCTGADAAARLRSHHVTAYQMLPAGTPLQDAAAALPEGKLLAVCGRETAEAAAAALHAADRVFDVADVYYRSVDTDILKNQICTSRYAVLEGGASASALADAGFDLGRAVPVFADDGTADAFLGAADQYRYRRALRPATSSPDEIVRVLSADIG